MTPEVWSPGRDTGRTLYTRTHTHCRRSRVQTHLRQQQEVVEQEAVELLAALGFEQLATVEELPGTQTVGDRVEHQLLDKRIRSTSHIIIIIIIQLKS